MTEAEARKQAKEEAAFYTHLATFVVVCAGLAALNLLTSPGYLWVLWVVLGWGVGVGSHAVGVFGNRASRGWVERRTAELMGPEASEARLQALLHETLDARALPAGMPQDLDQLQRRIEHLEAIVTATDDEVFEPAPPRARGNGRRPLAGTLDDPFDALPSPIATPRFEALDDELPEGEGHSAPRQPERLD